MPALTAAEREFLSQQWRWAESIDTTVKARHPGAREAEYGSAFVTIDGANVALTIMSEATAGDNRLIVATIAAALSVSFKGRPRTVRVYTARFGGDIVNGRLMLCERADVDHGGKRTTLYLTG